MVDSKWKAVCINCGHPGNDLYRSLRFSSDMLELCTCRRCGRPVDKYVEYAPVNVVLDALLLRTPVMRHILFNSTKHPVWRLTVLYAFSDAFERWIVHRSSTGRVQSDDQWIFFAAQERLFYVLLISVVIASIVLWSTVLLTMIALRLVRAGTDGSRVCRGGYADFVEVYRAVVAFSFGKFFIFPSSVWSAGRLWHVQCLLIHFLVLVSTSKAVRLCSGRSLPVALSGAFLIHISFYGLVVFIENILMKQFI